MPNLTSGLKLKFLNLRLTISKTVLVTLPASENYC